MTYDWVLIDGYSLMYRLRDAERAAKGRSLLQERQALVRLLEEAATALAQRVTVVFDGRGQRAQPSDESDMIEVLFSPGHQTADTVIERLVGACPAADRVLVVTSDRAERETTMASGAHSMSCGVFLEHCEELRRRLRTAVRLSRKTARGATLGDVFPGGKT